MVAGAPLALRELVKLLREIATGVLGGGRVVPSNVPLLQLGMDSVDAMLLKQRIRRALGSDLQFDWAQLETATVETLALQVTSGSAGAGAGGRLLVLERDALGNQKGERGGRRQG